MTSSGFMGERALGYIEDKLDAKGHGRCLRFAFLAKKAKMATSCLSGRTLANISAACIADCV